MNKTILLSFFNENNIFLFVIQSQVDILMKQKTKLDSIGIQQQKGCQTQVWNVNKIHVPKCDKFIEYGSMILYFLCILVINDIFLD